jgi:hypothetical protein
MTTEIIQSFSSCSLLAVMCHVRLKKMKKNLYFVLEVQITSLSVVDALDWGGGLCKRCMIRSARFLKTKLSFRSFRDKWTLKNTNRTGEL